MPKSCDGCGSREVRSGDLTDVDGKMLCAICYASFNMADRHCNVCERVELASESFVRFKDQLLCEACLRGLRSELGEEAVDSELKKIADRTKEAEVKKLGFHVGALFLAPLWLLGHGRIGAGFALIVFGVATNVVLTLGVVEPIALFIGAVLWLFVIMIHVQVGATGYEVACEHYASLSVEQVKKRERSWVVLGVIVFALFLFLVMLVIIGSRLKV